MSNSSEQVPVESPLDDPKIGFVKSATHPMWWNYAIAMVIVLFLVVLILYLVRIAVRSIPTSAPDIVQPNPTKAPPTGPTYAPYNPENLLKPLAFENFEITITPDGITALDTKRILKVDDVVLILNKDITNHNAIIQGQTYTISPNEVYAHKASVRGTLTLEILGVQSSNATYTFTVQ